MKMYLFSIIFIFVTFASNETKEEIIEEERDDEDLKGDSWMRKELKFVSDDPVLAKDANTKDDDWFDIYDPRNPLNKRRREKAKK